MLEEALPIAIGVGAALLPAMAFGGLAAARAFTFLGAGETVGLLYVSTGRACNHACQSIYVMLTSCVFGGGGQGGHNGQCVHGNS